MKLIHMRDFAKLCTDNPDMHAQVLAIPGTISPEKIFALAEKNGYQIVSEGVKHEENSPVLLDMDQLDQVTGGAADGSNACQMQDWFTWLRIWTGIGMPS